MVLCIQIPVNLIAIGSYNVRLLWLKRHYLIAKVKNLFKRKRTINIIVPESYQSKNISETHHELIDNKVTTAVTLEDMVEHPDLKIRQNVDYLVPPLATRRHNISIEEESKGEDEILYSNRTMDNA